MPADDGTLQECPLSESGKHRFRTDLDEEAAGQRSRYESDRYFRGHQACQDSRWQHRPTRMDELQQRPHHLQQHLQALCELEPKNKVFFEKNYLSLLKIIDKRDSTIREGFKNHPRWYASL